MKWQSGKEGTFGFGKKTMQTKKTSFFSSFLNSFKFGEDILSQVLQRLPIYIHTHINSHMFELFMDRELKEIIPNMCNILCNICTWVYV